MKRSREQQTFPLANFYRPLDFFVLRAPMLSLDRYRQLSLERPEASSQSVPARSLASEARIRRALAVGSVTFLDALARDAGQDSRGRKVESRLLRYLIRMATRPTPFGLFAGVALGRWGERTDLQLASDSFRQRTRPDMAWLMHLVMQLESMPEVRRQVRLIANPAALVRAGRIFLAERISRGETPAPPAVSIRATSVVRRALAAASDPIPFGALASFLLANTPGATPEKVDQLLDQLWEQTLLLTDLRPPLTAESPARYVIERLVGICEADSIRTRLQSTLEAASAWDASSPAGGADAYRAMVIEARKAGSSEGTPFQVDAGLHLTGNAIGRLVGDETARMAELVLRMSAWPRGSVYLSAYRRSFEQRYGLHREVPLLELLHPTFGLGPLSGYGAPARFGASSMRSSQRSNALMELALNALHERTLSVDLDGEVLRRLETWEPSTIAPSTLELFISIAAVSRQALDAGEFQLVLGPSVGAMSAGRALGRFADLVEGARDALEQAASMEERHAPDKIWAELVYQPRVFRSANVSIRPNLRQYEIALGVAASGGDIHTISVGELVVGIREGRFYVRWPAANRDVLVTSGHMLNYARAPAVCRFLAEVAHDGCCQLSGFNWGPAHNFPVLPRIQVGRKVLALAQWRITSARAVELSPDRPNAFPKALDLWRASLNVPRHVYLTSGDNRLLLDLSAPRQAEELRRAILKLRGGDSIVLHEVLPDLNHTWLRDSDDRPFTAELVVPLVLRRDAAAARPRLERIDLRRSYPRPPQLHPPDSPVTSFATHLRPPGSEWLFVKLYVAHEFEDDLVAGSLRTLARQAVESGMAKAFFFLRYNDPERHLRLRFNGEASRLLREFLPVVCEWAGRLIHEGICRRFVFDTYDQETERFGGHKGIAIAEDLFAADSRAVVELLHLLQTQRIACERVTLAVLTVDALLDGMGLDAKTRAEWCQSQVRAGQETSAEYRRLKRDLRALLADADLVGRTSGGSVVLDTLVDLRASLVRCRQRYEALSSGGELERPLSDLYQSFVHLHLNRLLGADGSLERRVLGLLWRTREGLLRAPLSSYS